MTVHYYAGIGSRITPQHILDKIHQLSIFLETKGYILRSGGASGADAAFHRNVTQREIYIPQHNFNGLNPSYLGIYNVLNFDNVNSARTIASKYHPKWDRLSEVAKKMMTRNTYQMLGMDLRTPSDFVICWTPDGAYDNTSPDTGGTGQAIRMAIDLGIVVYNLKNDSHLDIINRWMLQDEVVPTMPEKSKPDYFDYFD
jgi:hypothetical protein